MAEQGEIPTNRMMLPVTQIQPPPPPSTQEKLSAKRRRDEGEAVASEDTEESAPKRQAKAQDVIFRVVVPSRQIGKIIGKAGHRIQKIREESKATIKIADAIAVS